MSDLTFSLLFEVDKLGPRPKTFTFEANKQQCDEMKDAFQLLSLDFLKAEYTLKRVGTKKIHVDFKITSQYTQECVVTSKPVKNKSSLEFERVYDPDYKDFDEDEKAEEIEISHAYEVEPLENAEINLLNPILEEFSLALDPYPRLKEASFDGFGVGPEITEEETKAANPFAVLAQIKNKT